MRFKLRPLPSPYSIIHPDFTRPCSEKQRSRDILAWLAMVVHLLWCLIKLFLQLEQSELVCMCACTYLLFLQFLVGSTGEPCTVSFLLAGTKIFLLLLDFYFRGTYMNSGGIELKLSNSFVSYQKGGWPVMQKYTCGGHSCMHIHTQHPATQMEMRL